MFLFIFWEGMTAGVFNSSKMNMKRSWRYTPQKQTRR